jgi:two-component system alkaline phosphatase synthesis response regulator PhoP
MSSRILLIEDEPGLAMTLADLLAAEGHTVETAGDGATGLELASSSSFDLIILDVMLPRKTGYEVCRELRQAGSNVAILMLTARGQTVDKIVGLKLGADDYMAKPFDPAELLARIGALLRRVGKQNLSPVLRFHFGGIQADFQIPEVRRSGLALSLTVKEMSLLRHLIEHRGRTLSREEILSHVWEYQPNVTTRTVDVHIAWLRQKIEENPQFPKYIVTVRGTGYRFSA